MNHKKHEQAKRRGVVVNRCWACDGKGVRPEWSGKRQRYRCGGRGKVIESRRTP